MADVSRLRTFIVDFGALVSTRADEPELLNQGAALLGSLIAVDDWLPAAYSRPSPSGYRQYLLHCDSEERFCVVSFVWAGGQKTPIHGHCTWGVVGVLRGGELSQRFRCVDGAPIPDGPLRRLRPGEIETLSPRNGDLHQVSNALPRRTSVSIHIYGANIGRVRRWSYGPTGQPRPFVSGYSNTHLPNPWGAKTGSRD
jgi:predicted metal-dependent enzyme (double-stranded beta helix superfamily)